MVPCESLATVSYSHSSANMAASLAVSTQYTNVTNRQTDRGRSVDWQYGSVDRGEEISSSVAVKL